MPDRQEYTFEPTEHDPFAFDLKPVEHDPFATDQDAALAGSMTHQTGAPEPRLPAREPPYAHDVENYYRGGMASVLRNRGVELPGWVNSLDSILQNPDNQLAMGMANSTPVIAGKPEVISKIMDRLQAGSSQRAIAQEFGFSRGALQRFLDDIGQKTATTSTEPLIPWHDPENVATLKAMRAKGWSYQQIADATGKNIGTVGKQLARMRDAGMIDDNLVGQWESSHHGMRPESRTPSMPQFRTGQEPTGPPPPTFEDIRRMRSEGVPDAIQALREYLNRKGLSALSMPAFG
jgi:DNA-binding transcriptional ArsR family regulator